MSDQSVKNLVGNSIMLILLSFKADFLWLFDIYAQKTVPSWSYSTVETEYLRNMRWVSTQAKI